MAENTAPAMCSEAVYEAARAAGLLIVTTGEELALQKIADALQTAAYAEGRKDEREAINERAMEFTLLVEALLRGESNERLGHVTESTVIDAMYGLRAAIAGEQA